MHIDAYMPRSPASQLVGCGLRERLGERDRWYVQYLY